jgi:hypothetical protein
MDAGSSGSFSGQGSFSYNIAESFAAQLQSSGTLLGLNDPAAFVAVILNPFVR